ncbi:MAG: hypothetical protein WDM81_14770 [Rhizomicrobium sp.]
MCQAWAAPSKCASSRGSAAMVTSRVSPGSSRTLLQPTSRAAAPAVGGVA